MYKLIRKNLPDAGQPMGDESKRGHQEQQHGRAVFGITVNLAGYSDQPEQPGRFQQANECCRLLVIYRITQDVEESV